VVEFYMERSGYRIGLKTFDSYRIIGDGLVVEAAYWGGLHWVPMTQEIGVRVAESRLVE
jgi:hypothetical protein